MRAVSETKLAHWRQLDAVLVLNLVAAHAKSDVTFVATEDPATSRWHSSVGGQEFELLLTGPKFWDPRASAGGGGAIDLVMHLKGINFKAAIKLLEQLEI